MTTRASCASSAAASARRAAVIPPQRCAWLTRCVTTAPRSAYAGACSCWITWVSSSIRRAAAAPATTAPAPQARCRRGTTSRSLARGRSRSPEHASPRRPRAHAARSAHALPSLAPRAEARGAPPAHKQRMRHVPCHVTPRHRRQTSALSKPRSASASGASRHHGACCALRGVLERPLHSGLAGLGLGASTLAGLGTARLASRVLTRPCLLPSAEGDHGDQGLPADCSAEGRALCVPLHR